MAANRKPMSMRGRLKVAGWLVFGTAGCLAISLTYNYFAFRNLGDAALWQGLVSATVLPLVLAGPLFLYLTMKLRELAIANHRLSTMASVDSLTACLNRGAFVRVTDGLLAKPHAVNPSQGALLVIDADHFKSINDRFGHDQGDEALRFIASAIRAMVRSGDVVGRLGGEEFGVLLPGATPLQAADVAERIRRAVENSAFCPQGQPCGLSVSVGGVVFDEATDFAELFKLADGRLYQAKRAGRNRVELAQAPAIRSASVSALH